MWTYLHWKQGDQMPDSARNLHKSSSMARNELTLPCMYCLCPPPWPTKNMHMLYGQKSSTDYPVTMAPMAHVEEHVGLSQSWSMTTRFGRQNPSATSAWDSQRWSPQPNWGVADVGFSDVCWPTDVKISWFKTFKNKWMIWGAHPWHSFVDMKFVE